MMKSTKKSTSWSYKSGKKGRSRVRAYEDAKTGMILLEFREDGRKRRVATGHRDRERAQLQARNAADEIGTQKPVIGRERKPITLRELFDMYGKEVTPTKATTTQSHDRMASRLFLDCFGPKTRARDLNVRHQERFLRERRRPSKGHKRVGARTIERDLKWLHAVLNWAVIARDETGRRVLESNPLKGISIPKETSPNRPILTHERYEAMVAVLDRLDWRFKGALILAHETGHRVGAIMQLRWSDVDLGEKRVLWRKESDKMGFEHETPLTDSAIDALRELQEHNPGIGEAYVFPSPSDSKKPTSRYLARSWWRRAETKAELDHVAGLGWHGLRRKFATELKPTPLRDLCQLGGWKSARTVLECYQQPDADTMRRALLERSRLTAELGNGQ